MWGCRLGLLLLLLAGQAALEARRSRWRRELAPGLHLRGIRDAGGRYCQERDMCCRGRADDCALPYLGATCYCDLFCNRTVSDCCPDFWDFCLGVPPPFPPVQGGHSDSLEGGHLVTCSLSKLRNKADNEHFPAPYLFSAPLEVPPVILLDSSNTEREDPIRTKVALGQAGQAGLSPIF